MTYRDYTDEKYNKIFSEQYALELRERESNNAKKIAERHAQHTAMLVTFEDAYEKYSDKIGEYTNGTLRTKKYDDGSEQYEIIGLD